MAGRVTDCCTAWGKTTALSTVAPAFLSQKSGVFLPHHFLHCMMRDGSLSAPKCNCEDHSSLPEREGNQTTFDFLFLFTLS